MDTSTILPSYTHITIGILIFVLVCLRLYLRLLTGVPPYPENMPRILKYIAATCHTSLYLLLFSLPISGGLAWFFENRTWFEAHGYISQALIFLVLFHICAALFQEGFLGNKVMQKMIVPESTKH